MIRALELNKIMATENVAAAIDHDEQHAQRFHVKSGSPRLRRQWRRM